MAAYHILHISYPLASSVCLLLLLTISFSYSLTDSRRFVSWHVEVNFKLYTSASVLRFSLDWSGHAGEGSRRIRNGASAFVWLVFLGLPCPALFCSVLLVLCKYWNRFSFHKPLHRIVAPSLHRPAKARCCSNCSPSGDPVPVGLVASPACYASCLCHVVVVVVAGTGASFACLCKWITVFGSDYKSSL